MNKRKVQVLLSTYNGEKYLSQQLESLLQQENVDLKILIRDDGSSDKTLQIIEKYAISNSNIKYYTGENIGFAKSFWDLIKNADQCEYYAFCDQDDIWLPNKLSVAIERLEMYAEKVPALYTSNVSCIDSVGKKINVSPFEGGVLDVYESFKRSILPGCTFVFNKAAQKLYCEYDGRMYAHDWTAYVITNVFGKIYYDNFTYIKYRLHEHNTIGVENKGKYLKERFFRFFKKSSRIRMLFAHDFYDTFAYKIEDEELKKDIFLLGNYSKNLIYKIKMIKNKKFTGVIFKFYILIDRI